EHATRHLIYARFWHKFLQDIGVVSTPEPFMRLRPVGLIMGEDGRKMSKRFGNVINPDDIVERFGADSLRVYEMFMGPFDQAISWNTDGMVGAKRFLEKVWRLRAKCDANIRIHTNNTNKEKIEALLHQTIKKVTEDIEAMRFNTAVSALMILTNEMEKAEKVAKEDFEIFLRLLAPFAPHMTEELWEGLGYKKSVHLTPWPKYDPAKLLSDKIKIVVQVNGKTRGSLEIGRDLPQTEVEKQAATLPAIAKWLRGKNISRSIYVPERLLNFVLQA
ncbi:MAG: Leucine-tRNA ligase, partial [Candidatus Beckwithbacteria bacterium GW2011_GWC2_47_9]